MHSTFIQPSEVVCAAYFLSKVLYVWFSSKIIPVMLTFNMLSTASFSLESFMVTIFYGTFECVILL